MTAQWVGGRKNLDFIYYMPTYICIYTVYKCIKAITTKNKKNVNVNLHK